MKRIGIAASKIAKENIVLYNCYVVLLSGLFSLLVFLLSGLSLLLGFVILSFVNKGFTVYDHTTGFAPIFMICMAVLAAVVGILNMCSIIMNARLK